MCGATWVIWICFFNSKFGELKIQRHISNEYLVSAGRCAVCVKYTDFKDLVLRTYTY